MKETFKDIPNYNGDYQIPNLGRVKSLKWGKERLLNNNISPQGYFQITLSKKGKQKCILVHKLVAVAFLEHKPSKWNFVINHVNFNKLDNRVENLEIITQRENTNKKHLKSSSKFVGVRYFSLSNKWIATIRIKGKSKHLGYFDEEIEASNAYQKALNIIANINVYLRK